MTLLLRKTRLLTARKLSINSVTEFDISISLNILMVVRQTPTMLADVGKIWWEIGWLWASGVDKVFGVLIAHARSIYI